MVERFFISFNGEELRQAVLVCAFYSKGGISEWLEMASDEFVLWLQEIKKLNRTK